MSGKTKAFVVYGMDFEDELDKLPWGDPFGFDDFFTKEAGYTPEGNYGYYLKQKDVIVGALGLGFYKYGSFDYLNGILGIRSTRVEAEDIKIIYPNAQSAANLAHFDKLIANFCARYGIKYKGSCWHLCIYNEK